MILVKVIVVSLLMVLIASCAPKATQAPAPTQAERPATSPAAPAPATQVTKAAAKQAWEEEWDKIVEGAKKEGRILVYTNSGEYRPSWSAAMERYGVKLEMIVGRGSDYAEKIMTERRAGLYTGDIFTGGTTTPLTLLKPKGAFDSMDSALILPEVKDPKMWFGERLPFLDKDRTIFTFFLYPQPVLAINTTLVKPGDIKSWNDLLDPRWRGKIVMNDPTLPGAGGNFAGVIGGEVMGWDYMRKLAEAKPAILRDQRQQMEWLAHGKVAIVVIPLTTEFTAFQKAGAPIAALIPEEGGYLTAGTGSCSLLNRAAHPNAARVFLNWLVGKEGQTAASKAAGSQSARVDVATDFLDPLLIRDPSKKYFLREREEYLLKQDEHFKIAKEVFKDILK